MIEFSSLSCKIKEKTKLFQVSTKLEASLVSKRVEISLILLVIWKSIDKIPLSFGLNAT